MKALELIPKDWLMEVGGDHPGEYTATLGNERLIKLWDLKREGGVEPSQVGDVFSVQEDGTLQTRPPGAKGSFERLRLQGNIAIYRPFGKLAYTPFGVAGVWPVG